MTTFLPTFAAVVLGSASILIGAGCNSPGFRSHGDSRAPAPTATTHPGGSTTTPAVTATARPGKPRPTSTTTIPSSDDGPASAPNPLPPPPPPPLGSKS